MVLSLSKLPNRTHWWNFKSSSATDVVPVPPSTSLSFNPNLHSGMPDSLQLNLTAPDTSCLSKEPSTATRAENSSTTSRYTSFCFYLMLGPRQLIAPVAWLRVCRIKFELMSLSDSPSLLTYILSNSGSVICG